MLHGKAMSYNNYVDADAARRAAYDFAEPCVAIIKHSNPCGIAIGADIADAYAKALACDPLSAYGGVVAANGTVTAAMAHRMTESSADVVIAPDYEDAALRVLTRKWKNVRLLRVAEHQSVRKKTASNSGRSAAGCWCSRRTSSTLQATIRSGGS